MRLNKYDSYIIAMLLLLVFGTFGGAFQPIRVLTIFLFFYYYPLVLRELNYHQLQYKLLLVLGVYGAFSTFFYIDNYFESFVSYIYFIINIMLYTVFFSFYKNSQNKFKSVVVGMYLFLIISLPYSVYEIETGNHLSMNLDHGVESLINRSYSSFTFGNYNTYVMVLIMILPIIIYTIIYYNLKFKIISLVFFLLISYVVLMNGSRTGAFLLGLSILFFILKRGRNFIESILSKVIVLLVSIVFLIKNPYIWDALLIRFNNSGLESTERAENLILPFNGLISNLFLGFGIGNYKYYMEQNYPEKSILAPHNFFGEIFYELGILGLLVIIFILINALFKVVRKDEESKFIFYSIFLIFPFFSIINSGYLMGVYVWIYLSLIVVISYFGVKNDG